MNLVAVVGATGFIGRRVSDALQARGAKVRAVSAPRLSTREREPEALAEQIVHRNDVLGHLHEELRGTAVVINAAGIADATRSGGDALFGANALLPGLLGRACEELEARLVHVSSAAVQGRRPVLDETPQLEPFSPYSRSKAAAELLLHGVPHVVIFRPTSVHGSDRVVTKKLRTYAASPVAAVARPGDDPTPQVQVRNVADAIAFVALSAERPPSVILQPSEGLTTAQLIRILGDREPLQLPRGVAQSVVSGAAIMGRTWGGAAGAARRLEMLWFGQRQRSGWLDGRWAPVVAAEGWRELR